MSIIYQLSPLALTAINFIYQFFYGLTVRQFKLDELLPQSNKSAVIVFVLHALNAVIGTIIFASLFFDYRVSLAVFSLMTARYIYKLTKEDYREMFTRKERLSEGVGYFYMNTPYIVVFGAYLLRGVI